MKHTNDTSAFPRPVSRFESFGAGNVPPQDGMTLRDYFAIEFAARRYIYEIENPKLGTSDKNVCGIAYSLADSMLEARLK